MDARVVVNEHMPALLNSLHQGQRRAKYLFQRLRFTCGEYAIFARTSLCHVVPHISDQLPVAVDVSQFQSALGNSEEDISLIDNSLVSGSAGHGANANAIVASAR